MNFPRFSPLETNFDAWLLEENNELPGRILFLIAGKEHAPTTGQVHAQFAVQFRSPLGLQSAKTELAATGWCDETVHLEVKRGTWPQAVEYCQKEGHYRSVGEQPQQGQRTDVTEYFRFLDSGASVYDAMTTYPVIWSSRIRATEMYVHAKRRRIDQDEGFLPKDVYVLWGASGVGKTRFAVRKGTELGGRQPYFMEQRNTGLWMNDYDGESVVIIDDFGGWMPLTKLLRVLDGYSLDLETKGGTVSFKPRYIFITSNTHPREWYSPEVYAKHDGGRALQRRIKQVVKFHQGGIRTLCAPDWNREDARVGLANMFQ